MAEVEIDPETGTSRILRYIAVEDVGTVLNPMLLDGQIHGGVAQGAGHVFGEQVVWDENGQPLTGSFMDYVMPRADDLPRFEIVTNGVPTSRNPLGVKGAGEAGTVGAVACLTSAVLDALAPLGITDLPTPFTPQRLWRAIEEAKKGLRRGESRVHLDVEASLALQPAAPLSFRCSVLHSPPPWMPT